MGLGRVTRRKILKKQRQERIAARETEYVESYVAKHQPKSKAELKVEMGKAKAKAKKAQSRAKPSAV